MKLHEQRARLVAGIEEAMRSCDLLTNHLHRKVSYPYADGTCDTNVNINTDVLPQVRAIREQLSDTLFGLVMMGKPDITATTHAEDTCPVCHAKNVRGA